MKHAPVYLIYSCSPRKPSASLLQIAIAVLGRQVFRRVIPSHLQNFLFRHPVLYGFFDRQV